MKLKVFDPKESDGLNLVQVTYTMPSFLKRIANEEIPGYVEGSIRCREALHYKLLRLNEVEIIFGRSFVKGIRINNHMRKKSENLLKNTSFGVRFHLDDYGYLMTSLQIAPQIMSLLALILKEINLMNPPIRYQQIPINILKSVKSGNKNVFEKDYIFSAFYSMIFLDPNFENSAEHLMLTPDFGSSNGPGKGFYSYLLEHLSLTDNSGYVKASSWWKRDEIKDILNAIVDTKFGKKSNERKLFKFLMED